MAVSSKRYRIPVIKRILNLWPGEKTFGIYRFLPFFFVLGAALEFSMINWEVGQTNFYKTYKRRKAQEILSKEQEKKEASPAKSTSITHIN